MSDIFDVALVQPTFSAQAISDGVQAAAVALFDAACDQPFVVAATICVGAAALYGTAKAIEAVAPAVEDAFFQTACVVGGVFAGAGATVSSWFASEPPVSPTT